MGWFGKKRDKFVDLSAGYSKKIRRAQPVAKTENSNLNFLEDMANSSSLSTSDEISWDNETPKQNYAQEKKQKLAKRFLNMTEKMEDLSNQIYHLKQRMEVIEKKLKISFD